MQPKQLIVLLLIVLLGFSVRVINLQSTPPSLNWDEVSHGWNAYSILKTGQDEWGKTFPISNFRAYGDYPLPLNLYLTIPSIQLFGLSEFSLRFPHVLLGVGTIISTFFLVQGLRFGPVVSLLSALFVAIDPWTLFPSRAVFQSNLSIFFITAGFAFFFNREKHKVLLPISFFLLGLSVYSYHNSRIFMPLFLAIIFFIWKKEMLALWIGEKKILVGSLIILLTFFIPLVAIFSSPDARARSRWVFLIDDGAINKIIEQRQLSQFSPPVTKLIYNKYTYFASEFSKNYVGYISARFLFFEGGTQYQFSVPGKGLLYPINVFFFYAGIFLVILGAFRRKKEHLTIFAWALIGLIPASITTGDNHVIRSTTVLPLPQIFTALGAFVVWNWLKDRLRLFHKSLLPIFKLSYFVILALMVISYLSLYFGEYREKYSWSWQYGYKEAIDYAKSHYGEYNQIIVTKKYGEPHEFFLFYWPWDTIKYQRDPNLLRFYQSGWYWVDRFDKFYFVNDWEVPKNSNEKWKMERGGEFEIRGNALLITSPENYPGEWNLIETINFLDGKPAFSILERNVGNYP